MIWQLKAKQQGGLKKLFDRFKRTADHCDDHVNLFWCGRAAKSKQGIQILRFCQVQVVRKQICWGNIQRAAKRYENLQAGCFCARLYLPEICRIDVAGFGQAFTCPAPILSRGVDSFSQQLFIHLILPTCMLIEANLFPISLHFS